MTPVGCLWPSDRAGQGGAFSSRSIDILSSTVPLTRVLEHTHKVLEHTHTVLEHSETSTTLLMNPLSHL